MLHIPALLESKRSIRQCKESYQRLRKLSGGGAGEPEIGEFDKKNGIKTLVDWNRLEFNRLE